MRHASTDTIPLRGDLRIVVRRADNNDVHRRYEIRNAIMYVALRSLVNLIAQKNFVLAGDATDPGNFRVSWLRMGGYLTTDPPVAAVSPTRADINLTYCLPSAGAPFSLPLGDAQKTLYLANPFEMKINATLASTDLNGYSLTEAGMFIRGGTAATIPAPPASPTSDPSDPLRFPELFCRQIHPIIPKSAAFVIDYDWRIAFTA